MKIRFRKKHILLALVGLLGVVLIGVEVFVLSPDARIGYIGVLERARAWDSLVGMLDDDHQDVRIAASEGLVRNGVAGVAALIRGLDQTSERGRSQAVFTLQRIGSLARDALPALKRCMISDKSEQVRELAAHSWGVVGRDDPNTVVELLELLDSGDDAGRTAAARAVPSLGDEDRRRAMPYLIPLLKHSNPLIREESAEALGSLGRDARTAIPALIDALGDANLKVRAEVEEALEHIIRSPNWDDPALTTLVQTALDKSKAAAIGLPREP